MQASIWVCVALWVCNTSTQLSFIVWVKHSFNICSWASLLIVLFFDRKDQYSISLLYFSINGRTKTWIYWLHEKKQSTRFSIIENSTSYSSLQTHPPWVLGTRSSHPPPAAGVTPPRPLPQLLQRFVEIQLDQNLFTIFIVLVCLLVCLLWMKYIDVCMVWCVKRPVTCSLARSRSH